jgi:hypothetical protein
VQLQLPVCLKVQLLLVCLTDFVLFFRDAAFLLLDLPLGLDFLPLPVDFPLGVAFVPLDTLPAFL